VQTKGSLGEPPDIPFNQERTAHAHRHDRKRLCRPVSAGRASQRFGHDVVCVDNDTDKIAGLEAGRGWPIYEPGLEDSRSVNVNSRPAVVRDAT